MLGMDNAETLPGEIPGGSIHRIRGEEEWFY